MCHSGPTRAAGRGGRSDESGRAEGITLIHLTREPDPGCPVLGIGSDPDRVDDVAVAKLARLREQQVLESRVVAADLPSFRGA